MVEYIKREVKFLLILVLGLTGVFTVYSCGVDPVLEDARRTESRLEGLQRDEIAALDRIYTEPWLDKDVSLATLTDQYRESANEVVRLQDTLADLLPFVTAPAFTLPPVAESWGTNDFRRFADQKRDHYLRNRFGGQAGRALEYAFLEGLNLYEPSVEDAILRYGTYLSEAAAWKALNERPETEDSDSNATAPLPFPGMRPSTPTTPAQQEAVDEAAAAAEALALARARCEMRMLLLNIVVKTVESARRAGVRTVSGMSFDSRTESLARRFQVDTVYPCTYRPVALTVTLTTPEVSLFNFISNCLTPTWEGVPGQFLSLYSLEIVNDQCLSPNPTSEDITATVVLVAYLVDRSIPFAGDDGLAQPARLGGLTYQRWFH